MTLVETIEYAELSAEALPVSDRDTFWRCLSNAAAKKIRQKVEMKDRPAPTRPPMDEDEAQRFEKRIVPIGAHKGKQVRVVSLDYLAFLTDDSEFIRDLKRYVKSARYTGRCRSQGVE